MSVIDEVKGTVFNIQRFSVQDGPGIRTSVFTKGCPLECPWCSNPESIKPYPEVAHVAPLCKQCGSCREACALKAISFAEKGIKIDREKCNNCGKWSRPVDLKRMKRPHKDIGYWPEKKRGTEK